MLRRTTFSRISSYEFGHPTMNSNFSKEVYPATKAQPWGPVQKTTLNNGMKVITQDRKGQQSSVGFFVEAGPKFDPISAPGLSYVMRWAALTSNASESLFQFDRAMRSVGASYESAEINKRYLGWISEVPRQAWKTPIENMQTCFAVPRFAESDIERFRDTMDNELEEMRWKTPREYCEHMMETVAFFKEPLGNPRHVLPTDNDVCSHSELLKQYCKYFTPQRFTLAGINVDHSELIAYYGSLQYQLTSNAPHFNNAILERSAAVDETEAQQWYGLREGCKPEKRTYAMGTHPHQEEDGTFAIGWLTNGADKSVREYATSLVARAVLDAQTGDSLRTNRSQVHFGARTFYKPYSSTGLIGVTFRGPVDSRLKDEYKKLLTTVLPKSVASPDVKSAAARAALSYFSNNLETQRDALKTLATSTFEGDAVIEEIGKVTVDDVNAAFAFMKKNKPVTYSTGMIHDLPPLRQLALEYNF